MSSAAFSVTGWTRAAPSTTCSRSSRKAKRALLKIKNKNPGPNLIKLDTKELAWNKEKKAYVLDFDGWVKKGSVKNFQLACKSGRKGDAIRMKISLCWTTASPCALCMPLPSPCPASMSDLYTCAVHISLSP
ncbi:hypothetical protein MHYP_G00345390 [Metynnis hypsauchen]